jgi:flagellar motor protein MotB
MDAHPFPAATKRLTQSFLNFSRPAFREVRLIDFTTGKADLQPEHRAWLTEATAAIPFTRNFRVYIIGYASKLNFRGENQSHSDESNRDLSFKRANEVAKLMESVNPRITTNIERSFARGNQDYSATRTDNASAWRAVEVHIFLDDAPLRRRA